MYGRGDGVERGADRACVVQDAAVVRVHSRERLAGREGVGGPATLRAEGLELLDRHAAGAVHLLMVHPEVLARCSRRVGA